MINWNELADEVMDLVRKGEYDVSGAMNFVHNSYPDIKRMDLKEFRKIIGTILNKRLAAKRSAAKAKKEKPPRYDNSHDRKDIWGD